MLTPSTLIVTNHPQGRNGAIQCNRPAMSPAASIIVSTGTTPVVGTRKDMSEKKRMWACLGHRRAGVAPRGRFSRSAGR